MIQNDPPGRRGKSSKVVARTLRCNAVQCNESIEHEPHREHDEMKLRVAVDVINQFGRYTAKVA